MSNFKHSYLLFTIDEVISMKFCMRSCVTKQRLTPLIEHGGGAFVTRMEPGVIRLVERGVPVANVVSGEVTLFTNYIDDCVDQNRLLPHDNYTVEVQTYEVSDMSEDVTAILPRAKQRSKSRKQDISNAAVPDVTERILNYILDYPNEFTKQPLRILYVNLIKIGTNATEWMLHKALKKIYSNIDKYQMDGERKKKLKKLFSQQKKRFQLNKPDEVQILNYIIKNGCFSDVNDMELWKQMEDKGVSSGTSFSMKRNYFQKIIPNIYDYDILLEHMKKLLDGANVQRHRSWSDRLKNCKENSSDAISNVSTETIELRSRKRVQFSKSPILSPRKRNVETNKPVIPRKISVASNQNETAVNDTLIPERVVSPASDISYRSALEAVPQSSPDSGSSFKSTSETVVHENSASPSLIPSSDNDTTMQVDEQMPNIVEGTEPFVPIRSQEAAVFSMQSECIAETPADQQKTPKDSQESLLSESLPNSMWLDKNSDSESNPCGSELPLTQVMPSFYKTDAENGAGKGLLYYSSHADSLTLPNTNPFLMCKSQGLDKNANQIEGGTGLVKRNCPPLLQKYFASQEDRERESPANCQSSSGASSLDEYDLSMIQNEQILNVENCAKEKITATFTPGSTPDNKMQADAISRVITSFLNVKSCSPEGEPPQTEDVPINKRKFVSEAHERIGHLEAILQEQNLPDSTKTDLKAAIKKLKFNIFMYSTASKPKNILNKSGEWSMVEKAAIVHFVASKENMRPHDVLTLISKN